MYSIGKRSTVGHSRIHFYYFSTQELYPEQLTSVLLVTCLAHKASYPCLYAHACVTLCSSYTTTTRVEEYRYSNAMLMDLIKLFKEKVNNALTVLQNHSQIFWLGKQS